VDRGLLVKPTEQQYALELRAAPTATTTEHNDAKPNEQLTVVGASLNATRVAVKLRRPG
jgi:hypothetical protein